MFYVFNFLIACFHGLLNERKPFSLRFRVEHHVKSFCPRNRLAVFMARQATHTTQAKFTGFATNRLAACKARQVMRSLLIYFCILPGFC